MMEHKEDKERMGLMDFKEFQEYIKEHIKEMLPEEYQDAGYAISEIEKNNNRRLQGLTIWRNDDPVSPIIYLDPYFNAYMHGTGLAVIQEDIADTIIESMPVQDKYLRVASDMMDLEKMRDKVVMALVNHEKNEPMLNNVPYTRKEDLAIIYKVLVMYPDTDPTITVSNGLMEEWGIDAGELHELAVENSKRSFPARAEKLTDILRACLPDEDMAYGLIPEEAMESMDAQMYVITNLENRYGAAAVFYDDSLLQGLSEKLGGSFYLLPSSMQEMIAVPESLGDVSELAAMVKYVNETQVPEDLWLSDHVYRYDAKTRQVSLADADQKELGMEEEEMARPRRSR